MKKQGDKVGDIVFFVKDRLFGTFHGNNMIIMGKDKIYTENFGTTYYNSGPKYHVNNESHTGTAKSKNYTAPPIPKNTGTAVKSPIKVFTDKYIKMETAGYVL